MLKILKQMREILACVILFAALAAQGQVKSIADQTSTPIADSGHDYIKDLQETVNPANGQVSIRIGLPTGKARGYSLPLSIAYDSGIVEVPMIVEGNNNLEWASFGASNADGGWSYSIPYVSRSESSANLYPTYADECWYSQDYMFTDPQGGTHALYVTSMLNYGSIDFPHSNPCVGSSVLSGGGDGNVYAELDPPSLNEPYPRLRVVDKAGTVYTFFSNIKSTDEWAMNPGSSSSSIAGGPTLMAGLPDSIEDHNGNLTQFNWNGSNGNPLKTLTVTDSLGRAVLSSTFSGSYPGPRTITVPGATYTITYATVTANYTVQTFTSAPIVATSGGAAWLPPPCAPNSGQQGAHQQTIQDSPPVISSILLPNGESYQFYYGMDNSDSAYQNPYGLINEIIYPSGAWVKYQWQQNAPPQYSSVTVNALTVWDFEFCGIDCVKEEPKGSSDGGFPQYSNCYIAYDAPVLASREVGLPGSSTAINQQTFSYTTNYNTLISSKDLSGTPYKTTNVTTTDMVAGNQYLTHYAYTPSYASVNGNAGTEARGYLDPYSPLNPPPLPAEQSIVRYDVSNSGAGAVLSTTTKTYYNGFSTPTHLLCEFQTSASNQTTGHFYQYSRDGKISDDKEYGFGKGTNAVSVCLSGGTAPANPDRETVTNYQNLTNPNGVSYTVPGSVVVYDGTGSSAKETDYSYDQQSVMDTVPGGVPANTHDDSVYPSNTVTGRGNLTQETE
jgi:hypothetical protein